MITHIPFFKSLLGRDVAGDKATHSHVLIYGAIEFHNSGPKGCIASNKTISEETGYGEQTVANVISALAKANWIKVDLTESNHRLRIIPQISLLIPYSTGEGGYSPEYGGVTFQSNINNNNKDSINTYTNTTSSATPQPTKPLKVKDKANIKNPYADISSLLVYFYSKLVPAETSARRFVKTNQEAMDMLITTYTKDDIRATIDVAESNLRTGVYPKVTTPVQFLNHYKELNSKLLSNQVKRIRI